MPRHGGGLFAVSADHLEGVLDEFLLGLFEADTRQLGYAALGGGGRGPRRGVDLGRQVVDGELVGRARQRRPCSRSTLLEAGGWPGQDLIEHQRQSGVAPLKPPLGGLGLGAWGCKCSISSGMSSQRRFRSGGISMARTLMRKSRSSRNFFSLDLGRQVGVGRRNDADVDATGGVRWPLTRTDSPFPAREEAGLHPASGMSPRTSSRNIVPPSAFEAGPLAGGAGRPALDVAEQD